MTEKKYKPILFNTEMVQAILNGKKTQTRRVLSPQPYDVECYGMSETYPSEFIRIAEKKDCYTILRHPKKGRYDGIHKGVAPKHWPAKYQIGDVLWVRETWQYLDTKEDWSDELADYNHMICYTYKASNDLRPNGVSAEEFCGNWVVSTEERWNNAYDSIESEEVEGRDVWKPSIHMPKEAARIFLRVTNVRVERLKDISEEDAMAEGVKFYWYDESRNIKLEAAKNVFSNLWKDIYGEDSYKQNPFVFVYEFELIDKPSDF